MAGQPLVSTERDLRWARPEAVCRRRAAVRRFAIKLLEYEAKDLFRRHGIAVPATGGVVRSVAGLAAALRRAGKGPWVLKAQVLAGGRGKAGGVQVVLSPAQAREKARAMLGMRLATRQTHGQALVIREILVDRAVSILREMYVSIAMDRGLGVPVLIASAQGGVDIEELARTRPDAILREPIDPVRGLEPYQARRLCFALGLGAEKLSEFVRVARALAGIYLELDASLVEVNPLVLARAGGAVRKRGAASEALLALDGKIIIDDNALFRHPELSSRPDLEASALEVQAKKVGISYIGLDGNIGCLVNGAGLAMATMDTVKL
ncbi:MAG: hypothetical protein HY551_08210, partial [Elusimicrobia bacterium]|nr:hypothetical protein [Elusimicrobiota bacterium]